MDLLSDVLKAAQLRASLYFRASLAAPFAIDVPSDADHMRFHIGGEGPWWIGLSSGESAHCEAGDLVLVPHGGGGASTSLVCGHFAFDEQIVHPILRSLPPLIHIRAAAGRSYGWMDQVLQTMQGESRAGLPGYDDVLSRLSEVLLIQVLRSFMEESPGAKSSLVSLVDPHIQRALEAFHADPAAEWSVEQLAHTFDR